MRIHRSAIAALLVAAQTLPALAAVTHGRVWQATYVAAYQPTFGGARVPYSGTLKLKFDHRIVGGTATIRGQFYNFLAKIKSSQ